MMPSQIYLRVFRISLWAVACLIAAPSVIFAQGRSLEIDDLRLEVGVSDPVLSPDGSQAVVTTSTPNYEDNRFDRTLVLVNLATGATRELTPERHAVGQPRWSPSGEDLAFADAGEDGDGKKRQVFVLPMDGGEARRMTETEEGIKAFAWTADGRHLLYTRVDAATELEERSDTISRSKWGPTAI